MVLVLLALSIIPACLQSQTFPLYSSDDHRYLVDQQGEPFFLLGDAAWSLIGQLNYKQANHYLYERSRRGFNTIMVSLLEKYYSDNAPANFYNMPPFTGKTFVTPNEAYFALADSIIRRAGELGMCVVLDPLYLGFGGKFKHMDGWANEMKAASFDDMRQWGAYVGNRYKSIPNIIWMIGGDAHPDTAGVRSQMDTFVVALKNADTVYPGRLMTGHARPAVQSDYFPEAWLTVDGVYLWDHYRIVRCTDSAYQRAPTRPVIFLEGAYENTTWETVTPLILRQQMYWPLLRGSCGVFFGNCPVWYFNSAPGRPPNSSWVAAMWSPGTSYAMNFRKFFVEREWWKLTPDDRVMTSGAGQGMEQAIAATANDGSFIVAYLPSSRSVTVSTIGLTKATHTWRWYDCATGEYRIIANSRARGVYSETPPGEGDWVLAIDE